MNMEQGLYAQLVMIRRKYLDKKKVLLQGNITSKGSMKDQRAGSISIMIG